MPIKRILKSAPIEEPVSLAEAKLHLRLDADPNASPASTHPDDTLVQGLISASRQWCEYFQGRAYIAQIWDIYLDSFPAEKFISLPLAPLQYVAFMTYLDGSGASQTVSFIDPSGTILYETDDYIVDISCQPARICLKNGKAWPSSLDQASSILIEIVCGYGTAADVPNVVKAAILLKLSDLYENRGDDQAQSGFEAAAKSLLWPEKIVYF